MDIEEKIAISRIESNVIGISRKISTAFYAGILYLGISYIDNLNYQSLEKQYNSALVTYADTDKNNIVSKVEEEAFKSDFLKGKGAVFVNDWPTYSTGDLASRDSIRKWLEEYKP